MERQHISLDHILIVINRRSVITIQIWFDLTRFRRGFFVCKNRSYINLRILFAMKGIPSRNVTQMIPVTCLFIYLLHLSLGIDMFELTSADYMS